MSVRVFRGIMLVVIGAILPLSVRDATKEGYDLVSAMFVSPLAILSPTAALLAAWFGAEGTRRPVALQIGALLVGLIGFAAYACYALRGPSNPDTAGHMHVLGFPILYAVATMGIMIVGGGIASAGSEPPLNE
jgi:hypothetical protein